MPILPGLIANSGGSQPSEPTGIFATSTAINSFTIQWTAPIFLGKITPLRYVISLYDSSGSLINASYRTVNHPATSFTVDGLAEGTTYSVRMRLENAIGLFSPLSAPSANITTAVTPPPPPPPPSSPTWFCSQNAVGNGASSYTSSTDDTQAICNSYAISCSTGGYPATPSIPDCPTNPPPGTEPVPSCAEACGSYGAYGSCINGTQFQTRTCSGNPGCQTTRSRTCCTPRCGDWGGWQASLGGIQERYRTCINADCTTRTETELRCTTNSTTTCGRCSGSGRTITQSCTTTTRSSDCSFSSVTFTRKCT